MKNLRISRGYGVRVFLDLVLLSFSYFVSMAIANLWCPINFDRFFLSGFLVVISTKLAIILIALFQYMRKDKFLRVLIIVVIYNLASFINLNLMNYERVYEVCAVNLIVDIFLIGTSRLIQMYAATRFIGEKIDKQDIVQKSTNTTTSTTKDLDNNEIVLLSMLKLMDYSNEKMKYSKCFENMAPLIIGKGLSEEAEEKIKFMLPKCSLFNISYKNPNETIENLRAFSEAASFDSILILNENFYRLEFLDILDIVKDYPYNIEILDKNYHFHSVEDIDNVFNIFPLNIDYKISDIKGSYLLIYTGDWCAELAKQLVQGGADSVVIYDPNVDVKSKLKSVNRLQFIYSYKSLESLFKSCDNIIYGLPIKDILSCQKNFRETFEKNISITQDIINLTLKSKAKQFTFISSSISQNKVFNISKSYIRVEEMVQSLEGNLDIDFQVIRMPSFVSKDNVFLNELKSNPSNKIVEVSPQDVLTYFYSEEEAVKLLLHLMKHKRSFVAYMGEQVYLPEIYNSLNFNGAREDEVKVIFKKGSYPLNHYFEDSLDINKYQRSNCIYGYFLEKE